MLLVTEVELPEEPDPLPFAARDLVEILLHLRREVAFDKVAKVLAEQLGHRERGEARHERLPLSEDIASAHNRGNSRRVGGWPPDAQALELFDERSLGKPRGRRRLMSL